MIINRGLPEDCRGDTADLFLSALGEKFIPILGKKSKAKRLLELSIHRDNCFSAVSESGLLGFLAFQVNKTTFLNPSLSTIISVYGIFGGILKAIGLSMLAHKAKVGEMHIEAVAVSELARGKGIGTKLFDSLFQLANEKGCSVVTLEVVDTNPRAKKLYEKMGFEVVKQDKIWPLNKLIGWPFSGVFLMRKCINLD